MTALQVLHVSNLGVSFGGLCALTDFELSLPAKCLYGLIGPNGAGKTTVFNLLTGVYQPSSGAVILAGQNVVGKSQNQIANAGLSRTFQNIRLFSSMTVLENVLTSFHPYRQYGALDWIFSLSQFQKSEKKMREEAERILTDVGITSGFDRMASSLSYGHQRRLEIARALATRPKVLLLDEPAAGMNTQEKRDLMHTITKIRKTYNLSIVLIDHDMHLVMGICEKITVLDRGKVIAFGEPSSIQANPAVINAYLGVA